MYVPAIIAIPIRIVFVLGVIVWGIGYMAVGIVASFVNAVLDR